MQEQVSFCPDSRAFVVAKRADVTVDFVNLYFARPTDVACDMAVDFTTYLFRETCWHGVLTLQLISWHLFHESCWLGSWFLDIFIMRVQMAIDLATYLFHESCWCCSWFSNIFILRVLLTWRHTRRRLHFAKCDDVATNAAAPSFRGVDDVA